MGQTEQDQDSLWVKTPVANLVRYKPSRTYFARAKVGGKLIRKSLKTKVLSVAKLRLGDEIKKEHQTQELNLAAIVGKMSFQEAWEKYKQRMESNSDIKPSTKKYKKEIFQSLLKTWPSLPEADLRKITKAECLEWRTAYAQKYGSTRLNGAVSLLRHIIQIGIDSGIRYDNPANLVKRAKVKRKHLHLPEPEQFEKFVDELEAGGGRASQDCADLVRFLAYGGFRKTEAANITWSDCNFAKNRITVKGDPETGTKNSEVREVPMIPDMKKLLERLRAERSDEPKDKPVMQVRECQKAMDRAAKVVGMERITHHDLRHLFATRCIESGVDIPTVSRWLGHKDGGALAMKVYGHLRDQHSTDMAQMVTFTKTG